MCVGESVRKRLLFGLRMLSHRIEKKQATEETLGLYFYGLAENYYNNFKKEIQPAPL